MSLRTFINGEGRISRLHDQKGNRISGRRLLINGPHALTTTLLRVAFGHRPVLPWISYAATATLRSHLRNTSRVLEYGSGMSTLWFAQHSGEVYSVEDCRPWFDRVSSMLKYRRMHNVSYTFAASMAEYVDFQSDNRDGFDLIIVDGSYRARCVEAASRLLRPGGILYLDNSDMDSTVSGGGMREAESCLIEFARRSSAAIEYFTDFAPAQLFVQQGTLVRLP